MKSTTIIVSITGTEAAIPFNMGHPEHVSAFCITVDALNRGGIQFTLTNDAIKKAVEQDEIEKEAATMDAIQVLEDRHETAMADNNFGLVRDIDDQIDALMDAANMK